MEQDNFTNVTWSEHVHEQTSRPSIDAGDDSHGIPVNVTDVANAAAAAASGGGPGEHDDDLGHGAGAEKLECTVGQAIKENDGTKDAFVSYLITTNVSLLSVNYAIRPRADRSTVNLPLLPARNNYNPPPLHRLRLPLETALKGLPCRCGSPTTR